MSLENPDRWERQWMDAITRLGCIVCLSEGFGYTPAVVHHIIRYGRRQGHLFTIPLCVGHHNSGERSDRCVSRHPWKRAFEDRYGSESFLLQKTRQLIEQQKVRAA